MLLLLAVACAATHAEESLRHATKDFDVLFDAVTATPVFMAFAGDAVDLTPDDPSFEQDTAGWTRLGDVSLRWRCGEEPWHTARTSDRKARAVRAKPDTAIIAADVTSLCGDPGPLTLNRSWHHEAGGLRLRIDIKNSGDNPIELGGAGVAMVFNTVFNVPVHPPEGDHVTIHEARFYVHPSIAGDAGHVQVMRVNGRGPVLVVMPEHNTPLEAWRHIAEHPRRRWVEFEGFYEWCVHSLGWAETDWLAARDRQWNKPTSRMLAPGENVRFGFRFVVSPDADSVEETISRHELPVAIGFPGYVVPAGEPAMLFVRGPAIESTAVDPPGIISVEQTGLSEDGLWNALQITGSAEGPTRLTIRYAGGDQHHIHYRIIAPPAEIVQRLARFHVERQWRHAPDDPFGRRAAFMPFDREADQMVVEHRKDYIVGLSDEPGAGATLLMAMKNLMQPDATEVALLEQYVEETLWKNLQNEDYSVRAALHWGGEWHEGRSRTTWRAYNYPHQAAVYWVLHRLARDYDGLVRKQSAEWYLRQAYRTAMAMKTFCGPGTGDGTVHQLDQWGLMVGSVFRDILFDLQRAGLKAEADELEVYMRSRADLWGKRRYPFGSEMPWGPTGQEEIYTWCDHFGMRSKALATIDTIRAGAPLATSWGYNGSMHFYFAALTYGKWNRVERELHWYLSSLCAIPLLREWERDPARLDLLRRGHAGSVGVLTNVNEHGHGSMSFHAAADMLDWDPYSSDFGVHFYGYCRTAGTYVARDQRFGWLGFGGRVVHRDGRLTIIPTDAFRRRVVIGPAGVAIMVDAGAIDRVEFDLKTARGSLWLCPGDTHAPAAIVRLAGSVVDDHPETVVAFEAWRVQTEGQPVKLSFKAVP